VALDDRQDDIEDGVTKLYDIGISSRLKERRSIKGHRV
jgi:hypothetical protein